MVLMGLTGSIGMGKSTTAKLFEEEGCVVWDADNAVHRLYAKGGAAVPLIQDIFPEAIQDGYVSRTILREIIARQPDALKKIESVVHPLVAQDRARFAEKAVGDVIVFDIPLLFENSLEQNFDKVICVSVDPKTQQNRVLARGNMTEADFDRILSHQMSDEEKRRKSDYVIVTDTIENARAGVREILREVRIKEGNA